MAVPVIARAVVILSIVFVIFLTVFFMFFPSLCIRYNASYQSKYHRRITVSDDVILGVLSYVIMSSQPF